jgi:hypothetical protein
VHRRNADAHDDAGDDQHRPAGGPAPDQPEAQSGDGDGQSEGEQGEADVVIHVHRHAEGQHGDEVHGPDAAAHGDCCRGEPEAVGPAPRGLHAAGEIERRVGREGGDQNREGDQNVVVGAGNGHHPFTPREPA